MQIIEGVTAAVHFREGPQVRAVKWTWNTCIYRRNSPPAAWGTDTGSLMATRKVRALLRYLRSETAVSSGQLICEDAARSQSSRHISGRRSSLNHHLRIYFRTMFVIIQRRARRRALLIDSCDLENSGLTSAGVRRFIARSGIFEMSARLTLPADTTDTAILGPDSAKTVGVINWPCDPHPRCTREDQQRHGAESEERSGRLESVREAADEWGIGPKILEHLFIILGLPRSSYHTRTVPDTNRF